jgi:hypothetical protein
LNRNAPDVPLMDEGFDGGDQLLAIDAEFFRSRVLGGHEMAP